jgi:hypothetical protein
MNVLILTGIISLASTFSMGFSPATAETIMSHAVNQTYDACYDLDGDGVESVLDAVGVLKQYHENVTNGQTITLDADIVERLLSEQTDVDVIYWEIDFIEGVPCRKYECTATEDTRLHIYYETEEECSGFEVVVEPFSGLVYSD